jgi:hypothetical protein
MSSPVLVTLFLAQNRGVLGGTPRVPPTRDFQQPYSQTGFDGSGEGGLSNRKGNGRDCAEGSGKWGGQETKFFLVDRNSCDHVMSGAAGEALLFGDVEKEDFRTR